MLDDQSAARFWVKVERGAETDCWPWTAGKSGNGYGIFSIGPRSFTAHRLSMEIACGPIGENLVVDHVCRNRACVNPSHLRAVSRKQNVHENSEALAHLNSLKVKCLNGHELSGGNLIIDRGKRRCRACKNEAQRQRRAGRRSARKGESPVAEGHAPDPKAKSQIEESAA